MAIAAVTPVELSPIAVANCAGPRSGSPASAVMPARRAHVVRSWFVAERAVLSHERDRTHDEARIDRFQIFIAEAHALHHAWRKVLDYHVGLCGKRLY
jgi:hypothetical protein